VADCLFCKIAAKEVDADVVYESERVIGFRDINPKAPTHVLVIPRQHIASVQELSAAHGELLTELFETMSMLAAKSSLDGGFRIVTNSGPDAGQSVPHLHFHLMGGRRMSWPPG
jgi:histidine triad (HIT) family protein